MKHFQFLILFCGLFNFTLFGQEQRNEPYSFKFNRIDYFAPAGPYSESMSKIFKCNTYITIDLNVKTVTILTYYSDGPTESTYKIEEVIEKDNFYRFTCRASNYAEVIIDLDFSVKWIKRTIPHNGIYHKFYNY
jgi:hypothetical protein